MKTILTIIVLTIGLNLSAQDTRLFDNQWYLQSLIMDGETIIPPVNEEIPFVPLDFSVNGEILTGICESGGAGIVVYTGTSQFTIDGGLVVLTGGCYDSAENEEFNDTYIRTFWQDTSSNMYQYEIIEDGMDKTLIITNSNNDEAFYSNMLLNTQDFSTTAFKIHPNPAHEYVYIEKELNTTITSLKISDVNGRIVYFDTQINTEIPSVNIENLKSGLYFISIEDSEKRIVIQKFIKR